MAAFQSEEYSGDKSKNGMLQKEVVNWIAENYEGFNDPIRRQNLNQGVYMTLTKFFARATGNDKLKKNRWIVKDSNDPNSLVPEKRKGISINVQPIKKIKENPSLVVDITNNSSINSFSSNNSANNNPMSSNSGSGIL